MEKENPGIKQQKIKFPKNSLLAIPFVAESDSMESARSQNSLLHSFQPFKTQQANLSIFWTTKMISTHPLENSKYCCMMMRVSVDCKACQTKLRRILLSMKEVETHMIERQFSRVSVCGRFRPSDVALKVQKGMNRRVGILEIQEFDGSGGQPPYG